MSRLSSHSASQQWTTSSTTRGGSLSFESFGRLSLQPREESCLKSTSLRLVSRRSAHGVLTRLRRATRPVTSTTRSAAATACRQPKPRSKKRLMDRNGSASIGTPHDTRRAHRIGRENHRQLPKRYRCAQSRRDSRTDRGVQEAVPVGRRSAGCEEPCPGNPEPPDMPRDVSYVRHGLQRVTSRSWRDLFRKRSYWRCWFCDLREEVVE